MRSIVPIHLGKLITQTIQVCKKKLDNILQNYFKKLLIEDVIYENYPLVDPGKNGKIHSVEKFERAPFNF